MNDEAKKSSQAVKELIERILMMGVGAAAITRDKLQELVDEFVKRGELTREEGQKLMEEAGERAAAEGASIKEKASDTYQETLRTLGIASREAVEELDRRIAVLEAKVYSKQSPVEEPPTGFSSTTTEEEEPS